VSCQANLHQTGLAVLQYAHDYNEHVPPIDPWYTSPYADSPDWLYWNAHRGLGILWKCGYIKDPGFFVCFKDDYVKGLYKPGAGIDAQSNYNASYIYLGGLSSKTAPTFCSRSGQPDSRDR